MSFDSIFFKSLFTFLTLVHSFPFSTFLRHGNLVLSSFQISNMFFSISFASSCSSSWILKPSTTFSCRLPMSSTTTLTFFRNTSPPFLPKAKKHCSFSLLLLFSTWLCGSSSIFFLYFFNFQFLKVLLLSYLTLLVHKPLFSYIKHTLVSPYCMHSFSIPINFGLLL